MLAQGRRLRSTSLHVLILAPVVREPRPTAMTSPLSCCSRFPVSGLGSSGGSSLDSADPLKSGGAKVHALGSRVVLNGLPA